MTTSDINGIIVGALIAIFGASLLSIFRYWVTNRVESKQWGREQRAQEIERIDVAAANVSQHATILMFTTHTDPAAINRARIDIRANYTRWNMLINLHCTEEEREKIQRQLTMLHHQSHPDSVAVNETIIEITHAVKERLIKDNKHPRWQFWK